MKKMLFLAATAAIIALSSCSNDDIMSNTNEEVAENIPVAFTSYIARETRATDITTTASIQAAGKGFGVYAYDHGTQKVENYTKSYVTLNFMDNQHVTYQSGSSEWGYNPVKYWPNTDGSMISFYAYAPYVDGMNSSNKTAPENPKLILRGEYNGPALYYQMPEDLSKGIDLCYGELEGTGKAAVNRLKPTVNEKIKFNFKHALARYGFNVQVFNDMITDGDHHGTPANGGALAAGTTIKIKSLKLVGNMATSGVLSLYNGKWDAQVATSAEYELKSGFSSAVENITGDDAAEEIALFNSADDYVLLIPGSQFRIQIAYDVVTEDGNLLNGESCTENVVTSEEYFTAMPGVATKFHLNLGMNTVKFDAEVVEWGNETTSEVDLPNNTVIAATQAANYIYDDNYNYTGSKNVNGNTVTFTYASADVSATKKEILDDLARYLGALYRAGGINEIKWSSNTYEWNPTAAGNLKGSNWWNATTSQTLVKELTTWFASNQDATQITIKCDGVDLVLKFVVE